MTGHFYEMGRQVALTKLGMKLTFDNPQQAAAHAKTRGTIGDVAGFAGNVGGGLAGGALGGMVGGLPGNIAGGLGGSYIGEKALAFPAQTAYDAQHDVRQKYRATKNRALSRMNAAMGMPTGAR